MPRGFLLGGLAVWVLAGCERAEPVTYRIPKEEPREVQSTHSPHSPPTLGNAVTSGGMRVLPGMERAGEDAGGIHYTVPDGWEVFPAAGIRKANFRIGGGEGSAEVTILVFPGDVGGDLANVNRWAGQIGHARLSAGSLSEVAKPYSISDHRGLFVRLEGDTESILGGLLPFHGVTWFFKMQGETSTVLREEEAMKAFLDSIRLEDEAH